MTPVSFMPDDIPTLKRLLASRDEMIARLIAEIARLKRWQHGRSAERMDETLAQLQLALGDLQASAQPPFPLPLPATPQGVQAGAAIAPQAESLPRASSPRDRCA